MKMLEFLNPTFRVDSNVTVRKGRKWADDLNKGDTILVGQMAMVTALPARVTDVLFVRSVDEIPLDMVAREHDPDCRTHRGLYEELERIYGDDPESDGLTVVEFELLGGAPRPLIIDNRDIVADAKAVLRSLAGDLVYEAQATMERGDVKTAVRMSADAGNLNELASLLVSRQEGLMILLKYGGGGPRYLVEPESLAEMQRVIDEAAPPPGDAPAELLDGNPVEPLKSHEDFLKDVAAVEQVTEVPGQFPPKKPEGTADRVVEQDYREGYEEKPDMRDPLTRMGDEAQEEREAKRKAQEERDASTELSKPLETTDSPEPEDVTFGTPGLTVHDELGPPSDDDDEMLCYNCKEPVANPGEACETCQEEIDADEGNVD